MLSKDTATTLLKLRLMKMYVQEALGEMKIGASGEVARWVEQANQTASLKDYNHVVYEYAEFVSSVYSRTDDVIREVLSALVDEGDDNDR